MPFHLAVLSIVSTHLHVVDRVVFHTSRRINRHKPFHYTLSGLVYFLSQVVTCRGDSTIVSPCVSLLCSINSTEIKFSALLSRYRSIDPFKSTHRYPPRPGQLGPDGVEYAIPSTYLNISIILY